MADSAPDVPGMPCPECGARIVVTMNQVLSGCSIACRCGLVLHVDEDRSSQTLHDLRELQRRVGRLQS